MRTVRFTRTALRRAGDAVVDVGSTVVAAKVDGGDVEVEAATVFVFVDGGAVVVAGESGSVVNGAGVSVAVLNDVKTTISTINAVHSHIAKVKISPRRGAIAIVAIEILRLLLQSLNFFCQHKQGSSSVDCAPHHVIRRIKGRACRYGKGE